MVLNQSGKFILAMAKFYTTQSYVTKNVHRYAKRDTLAIPRASTEKGRTSFSYRGPLLWNNLKPEIRAITNLSSFKRKLKDNKESILSISFKKEASQITSKSVDFVYF